MKWYIIASIIGLVIGLIIIIRRINNRDENIFSLASDRIKKIGECCKLLFGGA